MKTAFVAMMAVLSVGCGVDEVGHQTAWLEEPPAGADPPSVLGSATVFFRGVAECSATLITPELLLTAAHCVAGDPYPVTADRSTPSQQDSSTNACWMHPNAVIRRTVSSCTGLPFRLSFDHAFDLAILRLRSPLTDVRPRSIRPPQSCFRDGAPVMIRGYGGVLARNRIRTDGILRSDGVFVGSTSAIREGDSGGTYEEIGTANPPLVGVVGGEIVGRGTSYGAFLWASLPAGGTEQWPIDWLWSVLDPTGACSLAATGPCVLPGDSTPLVDTDGDGLPDIRDLCPVIPLSPATACRGQHCDADGDWVGDECDQCTAAALLPGRTSSCDHADPDGDGIPSGCDRCPEVWGSATLTDGDGDGVPDACDVCPELAFATPDDGTYDPSTDSDSDRIPDPCDNCASRRNPDQANCNADAERAAGAPARGDVCDLVPCPDTEPETASIRVGTVERAIGNNHFRVDGLAEVPTTDGQAIFGPRVCRCDLATEDTPDVRIACRDFGCTIPSRPLEVQLFYDLPQQDTGIGWQPIETVEGVFGRAGSLEHDDPLDPTLITGASTFVTEFADQACIRPPGAMTDLCFPDAPEDLIWTWLIDRDLPRFRRPGDPSGPRSALRVVLWSHVQDRPALGCGPPGARHACPALNRLLSSNYWSGEVGETTVRVPIPSDPFVPAALPQQSCPECFYGWPQGWLTSPCIARPDLCLGPRVTTRFPGPVEIEVTGAFSPIAATTMLRSDVTWVAPAEPVRLLRSGSPLLIGVGTGAGSLVTRLASSRDGLIRSDLPGDGKHPGLVAAAASPTRPSSPICGGIERAEHGMAYWGTERLLFVAGGIDRATGRLLEDLCAVRIGTDGSRDLALDGSVRPGRVLAMAVDYAAGALWILDHEPGEEDEPDEPIDRPGRPCGAGEDDGDRHDRGSRRDDDGDHDDDDGDHEHDDDEDDGNDDHHQDDHAGCEPDEPDDDEDDGDDGRARLLRVDLTTARIAQIAVTREEANGTAFALAAAPDGAFYLVASELRERTFRVERLRVYPDGTLRVEGVATGEGLLNSVAVANGRGVSFLVARADGTLDPTGVEVAELTSRRGRLLGGVR